MRVRVFAFLKRPSSKKRKDFITWLVFVLPAMFFFSLFIFYPLLRTFLDSFFRYEFLRKSVMQFVALKNYTAMFQDAVFYRAVKNNFVIGAFSVLFQIGFGCVLAAVLTRGLKKSRVLFRTLIFAPMVFSTIAIGLLWQLVFDPNVGQLERIFHMLNITSPEQGFLGDSRIAIYAIIFVACWQYTGLMVVILISAMISISEAQYEAAKMEGLGEVGAFFSITIPNLKNTFLLCFLITMIGAMKVYDLVYALTKFGPNNATQVLSSYIYLHAFKVDNAGYANAIAVVLLIIAISLGILHGRMVRKV